MIYLVVGFIGAFLMFCGDMLLYYDPHDFNYEPGDSFEVKMKAILEIMVRVSPKRLMAGGLLGPIAAFLYCIGFYHIVVISNENVKIVAMIAFLLLCLGIIAGGAYHSHCAYLGLLPRFLTEDKINELKSVFMDYFKKMLFVLYFGEGIGYILLIILIITKNTLLPRWAFVCSPLCLMALKPIIGRLPKGIRIIISGGWSNLISVIYYGVAIACMLL